MILTIGMLNMRKVKKPKCEPIKKVKNVFNRGEQRKKPRSCQNFGYSFYDHNFALSVNF